MAKVFIIILNWNGLSDTLECLESVCRLVYGNCHVIVVDNGSSDGSPEKIRRAFPSVVVIENIKNLGYTGGNNVGIRYAMQHGADYVWLLNNDTVVDPESLGKLVDEAEKSSQIGLVSPAVFYFDKPDEIQFMGSYVNFKRFALYHIEDPLDLDRDDVMHNLVLWGTALLVKRSVLETIGCLSEKFFAYHEDRDYSFRAMKENFIARVRLDARIFHKDSRSTGRQSPIQTFLRTRNDFFLWKEHSTGLRKALVPCHYAGVVIETATGLINDGNEKAFDACAAGVWSALKNRGGGYDPAFNAPPLLKRILKFFVRWHPFFWVNLFKLNVKGISQELKKRFVVPL